MALAKYAEDSLEMYYEKLAMQEYTCNQKHGQQQNTPKAEATQNRQKERADGFRAVFAGESCFSE